jgi:DNA polymerase beta
MYGTTLNNKGKSEKNKKVKEGECIFPFKYKFNTHNECYKTEKGDICATSVNDHGTLQTYGYCVPFNKTKDSSATMKKRKFVKKTNTKKLKIVESIKQIEPIEPKKSKPRTLKKGKIKHRKLKKKLVIKEDISPSMSIANDSQSKTKSKMTPRYNEQFIAALGELEDYMQKKGEVMRARAYQKAQESIMTYQEDVTDVNQIKDLKGIGKTIISKLNELKDTGKIQALETEKKNPIHIFTSIYGIGPKKAQELIKQGITSIAKLEEKQLTVLTETQQMGLKYMEDINKRIPRKEIVEYNKEFTKMFDLIKDPDDTFEIVGSYRRGNTTSGDIDVIITDKQGKSTILKKFIDKLVEAKIIVYKLTDGKSKILVIAKLPGKPARRVDFLFSPPQEFPFAILYFTGSKIFNTVMRQHALSMGYSLNEHGLYKMVDGKKGSKLDMTFKTENDIFDFLNMEYKEPNERKDGRSVIIKKDNFIEDIPEEEVFTIKTKKKGKSLKKSKIETPAHNIKVYRREGQKYIKTLSEREIGDMIRYANDMYYNDPDEIIMTDSQFDIIKKSECRQSLFSIQYSLVKK